MILILYFIIPLNPLALGPSPIKTFYCKNHHIRIIKYFLDHNLNGDKMGKVRCIRCGEYFEQNIWGEIGNTLGTEHICSSCASSRNDDNDVDYDLGDASE